MCDILTNIAINNPSFNPMEKLMNDPQISGVMGTKCYLTEVRSKLEFFTQTYGHVHWIEAIPHVAHVVDMLQSGALVSSDDKVERGKDALNGFLRGKSDDQKAFARFVIAHYTLLKLLLNGRNDFRHAQHCPRYK